MTELLDQILPFLERHKMSPSRFGKLAAGSPAFVPSLERGRQPGDKLRTRVLEFLAGYDAGRREDAAPEQIAASANGPEIEIARIEIGERLRPLSEKAIGELMASMKEIGLIHPIRVSASEPPVLIAGAHRLEAAHRLGWTHIAATIAPSAENGDAARLAEIDENLCRNELSAAERALHVGERKLIYGRLHPDVSHGGDRKSETAKSTRQVGDLTDRFTQDAARKTGRSERAVQRDARRAHSIPQIADVVGTTLDSGAELDALAKLEPEQQAELIAKAKGGEGISARIEAEKAEDDESKFDRILRDLPDLSLDQLNRLQAAIDRVRESRARVERAQLQGAISQ